MPVAITIRNVPDDVRNSLAARAAKEGKSLQEYVRALLIDQTAKPTRDEWLERVRARVEATGTHVSSEWIVAALREDRAR